MQGWSCHLVPPCCCRHSDAQASQGPGRAGPLGRDRKGRKMVRTSLSASECSSEGTKRVTACISELPNLQE